MNEEEKLLVKTLDCQDIYIEDTKVTKVQFTTKEAKILFNLINKQQKEIEELEAMIDLKSYGVFITQKENFRKRIKEEFISKDKIKEKIGRIYVEYKFLLSQEKNNLDMINILTHQYNAMKKVLEELLGETNE